MFIKVKGSGLPYKPNEIVDIQEESIARAYISAGQAEEVTASAFLQQSIATIQAEMVGKIDSKLEEIKTTSRAVRPNPPAHREMADVGDDFDARGTTAADRTAQRKVTMGDITRATWWKQGYALGDDRITAEQARYGAELLDKVLKLPKADWVDRSEPGPGNPHGVTRDGLESGPAGGATYGYLVKPEFVTDIFRVESETDIFGGLRQIPMGSAVELRYPALDQYSTATPQAGKSNMHGGVVLTRKGESMPRDLVDAALTEIIFKITDLTAMTRISRDMLADAFLDLNAYLQDLFREAFGWRRDWDFLRGSGAGEPLGIFNAPSTIFGGGISGNAGRSTANKITYEDLAWMKSKMLPQSLASAYWIGNAQATAAVEAVKDAAGAYVYQPNALINQGQVASIYNRIGRFDGILMGLPFKRTEKAPALGTRGDLTLFAPAFYGEAVRSGIEVGISNDRYFELDMIAIRWKYRNDGRPMMANKIVGADGNTYSSTVVLN